MIIPTVDSKSDSFPFYFKDSAFNFGAIYTFPNSGISRDWQDKNKQKGLPPPSKPLSQA